LILHGCKDPDGGRKPINARDGFREARKWLELAATKEELEHLCQAPRERQCDQPKARAVCLID